MNEQTLAIVCTLQFTAKSLNCDTSWAFGTNQVTSTLQIEPHSALMHEDERRCISLQQSPRYFLALRDLADIWSHSNVPRLNLKASWLLKWLMCVKSEYKGREDFPWNETRHESFRRPLFGLTGLTCAENPKNGSEFLLNGRFFREVPGDRSRIVICGTLQHHK